MAVGRDRSAGLGSKPTLRVVGFLEILLFDDKSEKRRLAYSELSTFTIIGCRLDGFFRLNIWCRDDHGPGD